MDSDFPATKQAADAHLNRIRQQRTLTFEDSNFKDLEAALLL
jgi:hypothetical protein